MNEIEELFLDATRREDFENILSLGRVGSYRGKKSGELLNLRGVVRTMFQDIKDIDPKEVYEIRYMATCTILGMALYVLLTFDRDFSIPDIEFAYSKADVTDATRQAYVYLTTELLEEAMKLYVDVPTALSKGKGPLAFLISNKAMKRDVLNSYRSRSVETKLHAYYGYLLVFNGVIPYSDLELSNPYRDTLRQSFELLQSPDSD